MNKKTLSKPLLIFIATAATAVIAVFFRIFLTVNLLDIHGLYERDSTLPTVFHAFLAVFIIAVAVFALFFTEKRTDGYKHSESFLSLIATFTAGFLLAADALTLLFAILTNKDGSSTFDILEMIFAIPSAIFFMSIALKSKISSVGTALTSLFPTAWCAVCLIRIYFDKDLLMTNPGRILEQVALLAAMIAFLTESRAQLGAFVHRFFLAAAPAASVLLFTVSVPNLIYYKKLVSETSGSPVRTALCFAFALFFLARLLSYAKSSSADTAFKSDAESIEHDCKENESADGDTDNV